jgi:hypothetical protein
MAAAGLTPLICSLAKRAAMPLDKPPQHPVIHTPTPNEATHTHAVTQSLALKCMHAVPAVQAGKVTVQALLVASILGLGLTAGLTLGADAALAAMGAGVDTGAMHTMSKEFLLIRCAWCVCVGGGGGERGCMVSKCCMASSGGPAAQLPCWPV